MYCEHKYRIRTPDGITQCLGCEESVNDQGERIDLTPKKSVKKAKTKYRRSGEDED